MNFWNPFPRKRPLPASAPAESAALSEPEQSESDQAEPVKAGAVCEPPAGESATTVPNASGAVPADAGHTGPSEARCVLEFAVPDADLEPVVSGELPADLREDADGLASYAEAWLAARELPGMAFDACRKSLSDQAVVVEHVSEQSELWFIGDLHGDLLALESCLAHIRRESKTDEHCILFLGDLFDDGEFSYEVVLRVLRLIREAPQTIGWLAGNHDEAVTKVEGQFWSSVSPADFVDWLNARPEDAVAQRIGDVVIDLSRRLPRAWFLPDGLLVAHGGIPLSDIWTGLRHVDDLNQELCLRDFVWTRAHERAKKRIPDRTTRGCEFGREDFAAFCELAEPLVGQPVRRMLRGHDHVEQRYQFYERYETHPILTINAMCHRQTRELLGPFERQPCVARWRSEQLPEVHRLKISPEVIRQVYERTWLEQVSDDVPGPEV
jgi:hypothetical protein